MSIGILKHIDDMRRASQVSIDAVIGVLRTIAGALQAGGHDLNDRETSELINAFEQALTRHAGRLTDDRLALLATYADSLFTRGKRNVRFGALAGQLCAEFSSICNADNLDPEITGAAYSAVMNLAWKSASEGYYSQMMLRDNVVRPFSAVLERNRVPEKIQRKRRARVHVAYFVALLSDAVNFAPGHIFRSLWQGHHENASDDVRLFVYAYQSFSQQAVDFFRTHESVTLRVFPDAHTFTNGSHPKEFLRSLRHQADQDEIDAAIFYDYGTLTARIANMRVAPVQIYLPMSFIPFEIAGIDRFCVMESAAEDARRLLGDPSRIDVIPFVLSSQHLNPKRSADQIAAARKLVGPATQVFGTFCRLEKVSSEFVDVVAKILDRVPGAIFFVAGLGDGQRLSSEIARRRLTNRFKILPVVDAHTFGSLIDVYLETFPLAQGVAAVEAMAKGVPVIHMKSAGFHGFANVHRDPALIASSPDEFTEMAVRLTSDRELRAACAAKAKQIVQRVADIKGAARRIEMLAINLVRQKSPTYGIHGAVRRALGFFSGKMLSPKA